MLVTLVGCAVGPDYKRPEIAVPSDWRTTSETLHSVADLEWWKLFRIPSCRS